MDFAGASCVSETFSLKELVSKNCLPILVRLEEGIRGDMESLSLSSGDIIGLVACRGTDKSQGTILAHYISENRIYERGASDTSEKDVYRALIVLPLVNPHVASLEVSICQDPYSSYINTRFNGCDWVGREEEVLRKKDGASLTAKSAGGRADRWVEVVVDTSMEKPPAPPRINRSSKPVNAKSLSLSQTDSLTALKKTNCFQSRSLPARNTVPSPAVPARIPVTSHVAAAATKGPPPTPSTDTWRSLSAVLARDAVTSSGAYNRRFGAGQARFSEISSAAAPRSPEVTRSHVEARPDHSGNAPPTPLASGSFSDAGTYHTPARRQSVPVHHDEPAANCGRHKSTSAIYEFEDNVPVDTCLGFTLAAVYGDEDFQSGKRENGSVIRLPYRKTKKSKEVFQMGKLTKILTEQAARLKKLPSKVSRTLKTPSNKDDQFKPTVEHVTDDVAVNDNDDDDDNEAIYVELDETKMSEDVERVERLNPRDSLPPTCYQNKKGRTKTVTPGFSQSPPKMLQSSLPAQTHPMMAPSFGLVSKTGKG